MWASEWAKNDPAENEKTGNEGMGNEPRFMILTSTAEFKSLFQI
jgi:hypothetical protein